MICVNFDQHIAFYWTENNMVRIFYICNRKRNQIQTKKPFKDLLERQKGYFFSSVAMTPRKMDSY